MHSRTDQLEMTAAEIQAASSVVPATIKVSIVEDDEKLRETTIRYFAGQPGFKLLSAYPDAETALAEIPKNPPDVVLMDINLPGMNGIECVVHLHAALPKLKIIMLTVFEDSERVFNALSAGAFGYLVKSIRLDKILQAIRDVHEGGSPMSGHIARMVVQSFEQKSATKDETSTLTSRELEVLHGLSCGQPYKQIASDLGISLNTVRTYIQRIYEKLHVHSHTEAVMKYARRRERIS
jgi:DNA-binding NarL/FixJ family response regulator